ncbi:STAS domain-containing protein [Phragmitibacter flavus]|uniref:STAS domain-containing protein n=1 Tax=Phragmitibacter flavus TaxID=2576071 RepID=A0A5R8K9C8_9BACT|nr:STAS domain-containing protein [Phragmitibacter flavus]TLD68942.1 STAS domain-containing protein [Phragmitibacter flavus]
MQVLHEEQGLVDVFRISGRLDYTAVAADFDDLLRAPWTKDPLRRFPVLELSGVTMMSSQALRSVLSLAKDLKGQHGRVFVTQPSGAAREALKVSGFLELRIFELHEQLPDAVAAAGASAASAAPLPSVDLDPFKMPEPAPEPPPPPSGLQKVLSAPKAVWNIWQAAAGVIQRILDGGKK